MHPTCMHSSKLVLGTQSHHKDTKRSKGTNGPWPQRTQVTRSACLDHIQQPNTKKPTQKQPPSDGDIFLKTGSKNRSQSPQTCTLLHKCTCKRPVRWNCSNSTATATATTPSRLLDPKLAPFFLYFCPFYFVFLVVFVPIKDPYQTTLNGFPTPTFFQNLIVIVPYTSPRRKNSSKQSPRDSKLRPVGISAVLITSELSDLK